MDCITTTLEAFAAHCDRGTVKDRPTVFCQYVDIHGVPQGEIGLADIHDPELHLAVFAALCPWAMIPTIGSARLVVDRLSLGMVVTDVKANFQGLFNPSWMVPYSMGDDGRLSFGEPVAEPVPDEVGWGCQAAMRERMDRRFWEQNHSLGSILPVVEALLNQ